MCPNPIEPTAKTMEFGSQRTIQIFAKADRIVISVAKMHIRPFFKTTFRVKTHGAFCFRAGITSNEGIVTEEA